LLTSEALKIEALAVPVSCNTAIELCKRFLYVERTKIGSPYVIAEFANLAKKYSSVAGFEANGGYLLGSDVELNGQSLKALPTRDAVLPVIMLLMAAQDTSISTLVKELPQRFTHSDRIQNFATEKSQALIAKGKAEPQELLKLIGLGNAEVDYLDTTDGLRLTLDNSQIIHLRPSGNAPELRCYAETDVFESAFQCVVNTLNKIQAL